MEEVDFLVEGFLVVEDVFLEVEELFFSFFSLDFFSLAAAAARSFFFCSSNLEFSLVIPVTFLMLSLMIVLPTPSNCLRTQTVGVTASLTKSRVLTVALSLPSLSTLGFLVLDLDLDLSDLDLEEDLEEDFDEDLESLLGEDLARFLAFFFSFEACLRLACFCACFWLACFFLAFLLFLLLFCLGALVDFLGLLDLDLDLLVSPLSFFCAASAFLLRGSRILSRLAAILPTTLFFSNFLTAALRAASVALPPVFSQILSPTLPTAYSVALPSAYLPTSALYLLAVATTPFSLTSLAISLAFWIFSLVFLTESLAHDARPLQSGL